jgi:hypothetical protein
MSNFVKTIWRILRGADGFRLRSPMLSAPSGAMSYGECLRYAKVFGGRIELA